MDRLEQIKRSYAEKGWRLNKEEADWLIERVESLQAEVERLKAQVSAGTTMMDVMDAAHAEEIEGMRVHD